ncbi:MAG: flavin-containing monooxygenase [Solirubrobacteraceae bacterium]
MIPEAELALASDRPAGPRVLIVGAGFGGIAAAIELERHGFHDITILDSAPGVGGTWFYNSYPGATCDVPSHLYSYSFAQRRDWSRLCSPQEEILSYLRGVSHAHGVDRLVQTSRRVTRCSFDESRSRWLAETETGERHEADAIVLATGQLNRPSVPRLPGHERFQGHSFHSARWDHGYDLTAKRVAVIGTGASAVQFAPLIAERVAHMTVYQRTANWLLPRENRVYPPLLKKAIEHLPGVQWLRRRWIFNYCEALTLAIRHPRTVGRLLGLRSSAFMRRQLPDPELRAQVWPDYTFGCKRVLFSSHYLPALARDNVELVTDAITEVTEGGLRTADGIERELDCIIWSTGFRASEFMAPMRVVGAGGRELDNAWEGGAHAHLGLTVPGFPSMFLMYGPNTNTSGGSIIVYLEAQASYIRQALEHLRAGHFASLDVRWEVEAASDLETQARFAGTAWTDCDSWYRDKQGRIVANWPGYMREYLERTQTFEPSEYVFSR